MVSSSAAYDSYNAYISVFSGAGGDDAKDWADMLFRMYVRYAEKRGWKVVSLDDRSIEVRGERVYGILKKESGVHRLVRLSPFNAKQLRHTSFALVDVVPVLPAVEYEKIRLPDEDVSIETSRSSGPGGQNVNKRETAVRVVHLPTGMSASSQIERSQLQNKERALAMLKAKLVKLMEERHEQEIGNLKTRVMPEWGNQIRSYVLHPYQQVKDHRTGVKHSRPDQVLDGDLDKFIDAELEL